MLLLEMVDCLRFYCQTCPYIYQVKATVHATLKIILLVLCDL